MENKVCCFIGHRKIAKSSELREKILNTIENLIVNENVNCFFFGSKSEFDDYCTQEAIIMIEMNLVIDEIAKSENMGISNDELYEYANNKGYTQIDILKSSQLKKELEYEIIKNKVYDFLLLHSISQ